MLFQRKWIAAVPKHKIWWLFQMERRPMEKAQRWCRRGCSVVPEEIEQQRRKRGDNNGV